jgi:tripartite-type tricarboxylate transporter receptor subunit TctC
MKRCLILIFSLAAAAPQVLKAQSWPQRPVKVIVPFAAGGNSDTQARIISERLSAVLGQQFIVENRAGAGGAIGAEFVTKSQADGYTLLFCPVVQISILPLVQKVNYDPMKDLAPISIVSANPFILGIHISVPAKTLKEFIDYVKAHPGQMNYASGGTGSVSHLAGALFVQRAGLKMTHVPYKGGAPAVGDLVGGQVHMYFGNAAELIQHSKSGKLTLLGVSSEKRTPQFSDLPAIAEFYPGFNTITWNGYFAPAEISRQTVDRLAQEIAKIVKEPAVAELFFKIGVDPLSSTPAEFAAFIRSQAPLWREAVEVAGIRQQ